MPLRHSALGTWHSAPFILLSSVTSILGCEPVAQEEPLAAAVGALVRDAGIGTDEAFDRYLRDRRVVADFHAPQRLRELIAAQRVETAFGGLSFSTDQGRINLIWQGKFEGDGDVRTFRPLLFDCLSKAGFEESASEPHGEIASTYRAILKARAKVLKEGDNPDSLASPSVTALAREAGESREEILIVDLTTYTGGRRGLRSGGNFAWCVSRPYRGEAPTLAALLAAFPALQPVHREEALFDLLRDKQVFRFGGSGRKLDWRAKIDSRLRESVEQTLQQAGFARDKQLSLPPAGELSGGTQFMWRRSEDLTVASISTRSGHPNWIWVSCQAPQKIDEP